MKPYIKYSLSAAVAAVAMCLWSCQDDFDSPVVEAPVADLTPNMSIFELKKMYWDDAVNYIDTIGVENGIPDDKSYVISGRVISSDEAGNVFKSLVIDDGTAALALSVNSYNLYLKYRMGQEIVIDLKGMYIGKYNGLVQLGMPEWYANGNAWEATFMAPEYFESHIQPNGFPDAAKIDTLEINYFSDLPSTPDGLCRYQSRLVKFNNVYFQNGGKEQFSSYHSSGVNQNIVDVNGNTLPVRTSGYSNFWNKVLPAGNGDVVCILSYYGTTGWQLLLNDYAGCMNFGNPTIAPGTEDNPYTVADAIATINTGTPRSGWVSGYIVGAVAPEVTSVTSNADVEWGADVVLDNTLVIGATPDTRDISQAMVIALPQGSALRRYGNLADNPGNYRKAISVKGSFGMYMDTYGVLDNNGKTDVFHIEGVTVDDGTASSGDGSEAYPYNVTQVIAMNPQGNADNPDKKDVWVRGYIVGWADMSTVYYVNAETARFTVPATANTNILIAATPDENDWSKCVALQLPNGDIRSALNLRDNPGNLGRDVKVKGNIAKYSGVPGVRTVSAYEWLGDAPVTPDAPDPGKPDDPVNPGEGGSADFNTLNDGTPNMMAYGSYSTAAGWTTEWCLVGSGGTEATNFVSTSSSFLFPIIDGTKARTGKVTSPALTGGLKTLTFKYGYPYNETKAGFTINVLQDGKVVASDKVLVDPVKKATVCEYSHDFNVSGTFTIEIVNDCVTNTASGNKDRVAVWDLSWTSM